MDIKAELYGQFVLFGIFGKIYIQFLFSSFFLSFKVVINNFKFRKEKNNN